MVRVTSLMPQEAQARQRETFSSFRAMPIRLPFRDASFDLVLCNSVLHHMREPSRLLAEIRRIAKPNAGILLRDLRRPSRITYSFHVRWHGRHYEGLMYKLYCDSVRAAYTCEELAAMLRSVGISGARVFSHGSTHLGIERIWRS